MAKFTYIARDTKGERIEGALEVEDRQAVVTRLQSMGYFPIQIREIAGKSGRGFSLAQLRGRARATDIATFYRQLADLVSSGVPLIKGLDIILEQIREGIMRDIVSDISKSLQGGDTLARALQRHPRIFPKIAVAMVRAGETGGMLDDSLQRLADFAEAEEDLKGKVKSALAYPTIMLFAGAVVVTILVTVVIPKITGVFADMGQALPVPTLMMIAITDGIRQYGWLIVGLAVALALGFRAFLKSTEGRLMFDRFRLRIPILGDVIHKRELSRFARTLGNLLRNGVPILTALEITQEVLGNVVIQREVVKLPDSISQGTAVAATLGESPWFPPLLVSMIAIGEETAQLDTVLLKVAGSYESQVDRSLKTLTSLLEPMIILVLGVVVGFIVIAMMLPIIALDPTIGTD